MIRPLTAAAAVDAWVRKSEARMTVVFRAAAESVVEEVIENCPVDTGFLRASLTASLDGTMPPLRDAPADAAPGSIPPPAAYAMVIEGAGLGDTITVAFSARYAAAVEYGTDTRPPVGMVRRAAQNWPLHVARAVQRAKVAVLNNVVAKARAAGRF